MRATEKANVVVLAESFNLSIFSQLWLVEHGIIRKEEIESGQAFLSPVAVSISAPAFDFLVVPDRIQVAAKRVAPDSGELFCRIIKGITESLPETPYKAIGFNFHSVVRASDPNVGLAKTKELYLSSANPLADFYTSDDSRFGMYLSTTSIKNTRLRLDIKPSIDELGDFQALHFNFHYELENSLVKNEEIASILECWKEFLELVDSYTERMDLYLEGKNGS